MSDRILRHLESAVCIAHPKMMHRKFTDKMRQGGDSEGAAPAKRVSMNHSRYPPIGVSDRKGGPKIPALEELQTI